MRDHRPRGIGPALSRLAGRARDEWLLAAVGRRSGLAGRVAHLLDGRGGNPWSGVGWSLAAIMLTASLAGCLALAQVRPAAPRTQPKPIAEEEAVPPTIAGAVVRPDGTPAAGAAVLWIGYRKPRASYAVDPPIMPKGREPKPREGEEVLGRSTTDAGGRFRFTATLDPGRYYAHTRLVVLAEGAALLSQYVKKDEHEVALTLAPEAPIRGRLLTPEGRPAAGRACPS